MPQTPTPEQKHQPNHAGASRIISLALSRILLCALLSTVAGCSFNQVREPTDICSIFEQKRGWYRAAVKAEKKWDIPIPIPMAILYQESAFQARAKPPRKWYFGIIPGRRPSTAYGYAQAVNGTWQMFRDETGQQRRDRDDFSDALEFVNYYLDKAARQNGVRRDDIYHLYLNYHEGLAGYRRKRWQNNRSLLKTADRVRRIAGEYQRQYAGCYKSLKRPWWRRWF